MQNLETTAEKLLHSYPTIQSITEKLDTVLSPAIKGPDKMAILDGMLLHTPLQTKMKIMQLMSTTL